MIGVNTTDSAGIFASTCLLKCYLPKYMGNKDLDTFKASLQAAVSAQGKAFNSV